MLAMDVAGFEGGFPLKCADDSMDAGVRAATRAGVPVTIHAGECPDWKFGTVENVRHVRFAKRVERLERVESIL